MTLEAVEHQPQTYKEFCEKHGVILAACVGSLTRPTDGYRDSDWDSQATHHMVTLNAGDRPVWSGWYSMGIGHAERWARERKNRGKVANAARNGHNGYGIVMDLLRHPLPYGKRHADDGLFMTAVRKAACEHMQPDVDDVLMSLVMDARGSDESFENWASDLGYDTDSRKAHRIWEVCNETRRTLRDALGDDLFNELMECEE